MAKARRRKVPVTTDSSGRGSSSKPHSSRTVIRKFHALSKQEAQLKSLPESPGNASRLAEISHEIAELGGLSAYQRMSTIGQGKDRGGGSEKVLISWLKERLMADRHGKDKLKLLEVGALKPDNYAPCGSWLDVLPIDLRSNHPSITEQDYLTMDIDQHAEYWDIISLSLVVNFVPDPRDRGRMLTRAHEMLRQDGLLFLVLPLPCVTNSRYLTFEHLKTLMEFIGFEQIRDRWKEGGKMAYWLYKKTATIPHNADGGWDCKNVLRDGNRNNFCILL
ncbi:hypothetical protein BD410DRAFT_714233 [Rickenella mellea]|uniref:25S rRNA adenine-N(1) methyltransferase n=1 Tax=Rickenella mellea TaxID=50990 RepID=A0A4Y7QJ15_9AGAM|nr:hypothetical protein BD410DRAFT_714233 [Rickenella mellea]